MGEAAGTEGGEGEMSASVRPLAAALTAARTVEEVADTLVRHGMPAVGACVAVLALRSDDGAAFYVPRVEGYPAEVGVAWRRFPADAPVPIAEAVRTGRPVLLPTPAERAAYYPPGFPLPTPVGRALAAVPMSEGGVAGGLGFTFPDDRAFGAAEWATLAATAALCAAALGRVRRTGVGVGVLVAEDEPDVLAMLAFVLRYHGFAARSALGGEAAVRAFAEHRAAVDVALVDVQMPGLDGPGTLAALRAIDPSVRCVFMSGNTGGYTAEQLLALGAVRVLPKPFSSMDELIRAVRAAATP